MFNLCLFDLDQTLVETDDMTAVREAGKNRNDDEYKAKVEAAYKLQNDRPYYSEKLISKIRAEFPNMKIGIFTRSPRSYATTVLKLAYPSTTWDTVIAYEDVKRTKPYGEGIDKAMWACGQSRIDKVVLVGDGDNDVRAAYNAGCVMVLDTTSWPFSHTPDNWRALGHMPDATISDPQQLIGVLKDYRANLPELERLLSGTAGMAGMARFDRIGKFIPTELGGNKTVYPVFTCGRSFSGYASLKWRRQWHKLTESIHVQKNADDFPKEWVQAVRAFIDQKFSVLQMMGGGLVVTVIPHRPGRKPRLEKFLEQLEKSYAKTPAAGKIKFSFVPKLLSYKDGVRSNSNDKLGQIDRFKNIRDHLEVTDKQAAKGAQILVIDDVSTTGSSLIYAKKYLLEAGANEVTLFSIAMNISNVVND